MRYIFYIFFINLIFSIDLNPNWGPINEIDYQLFYGKVISHHTGYYQYDGNGYGMIGIGGQWSNKAYITTYSNNGSSTSSYRPYASNGDGEIQSLIPAISDNAWISIANFNGQVYVIKTPIIGGDWDIDNDVTTDWFVNLRDQPYIQTYTNSTAIVQSEDGNYVTAVKGNDSNIVIFKISQNGQILWTNTINTPSNLGSYISFINNNENFVFAIGHKIYGIDDDGNFQFHYYISNIETIRDIKKTLDDGYIINAYVDSYDQYKIIKINSQGETEWIHEYESYFGDDTSLSITVSGDGGFIYIEKSDYTRIVKLNDNGEVKWTTEYSNPGYYTSIFEHPEAQNLITSRKLLGQPYKHEITGYYKPEGCTNPNAVNYEEFYSFDDGSCLYPDDLESHYYPIWDGIPNNPMAIYLNSVSIDNEDWKAGDEIGVFDGNDCVGNVIFNPILDETPTIFASEFTEGNPITYKYWDYSEQIEVINIINSDEENVFIPLGSVTVDLTGTVIYGCVDDTACNYDENSTVEGECNYIPENECDCDGNVDLGCGCGELAPSGCDETCGSELEFDDCGVCDGDNSTCSGCTDQYAINYDEDAIIEDNTCEYPETGDLNNDTIFNIIDVVIMTGYVLNNEYVFYADLNEDDFLNILDILILVNWILE